MSKITLSAELMHAYVIWSSSSSCL